MTTNEILDAYDIPDSNRNASAIRALVDRHGEAGALKILTSIHGTPQEIAAGRGKRQIVSSNPAVNGRIETGMIQ